METKKEIITWESCKSIGNESNRAILTSTNQYNAETNLQEIKNILERFEIIEIQPDHLNEDSIIGLSNQFKDKKIRLYLAEKYARLDIVKNFIKHGIKEFIIPLDTVNSINFGRIFNSSEYFEKLWQIIDILSTEFENSVTLLFKVRIMRQNITDILPTIGWIINFGVAKVYFAPYEKLIHDDDDDLNWQKNLTFFNKDNSHFDHVIQTLKRHKNNYPNIIINNIDDFTDMQLYYKNNKQWQQKQILDKFKNIRVSIPNKCV